MKFNELLKQLRAEESLRDAAKRIGISPSYLLLLEKGQDPRTNKPPKPTPEVLKKIAKAYKVDYFKLIELAGYGDDANYNSDFKTPFPNNPKLKEWYLNLPNQKEEDVMKLMNMWELLHIGGK